MRKFIVVFILTALYALSMMAAETSPYIFVNNYTVDEYNASCQNWGLSLDANGMLYVANNSGLLMFDGNGWLLYRTPDDEEVLAVTNYKGVVYTLTKNGVYEWRVDKYGIYVPSPMVESNKEIKFFPEQVPLPFELPAEIKAEEPTAFNTNGEYYFVGTAKNGLYIISPKGKILQNISLGNQLQDNTVRYIALQDNSVLWLALDNGVTSVTLNPPLFLLEKRGNIGKIQNGMLRDGYVYMKTSLGVFKKSLLGNAPTTECDSMEVVFSTTYTDTSTIRTLFKDPSQLNRFADANEICSVGGHLYWLALDNEAALYREDDGEATLVCRLLFGNYNMNLVTRGRRFFPLDENLLLVSTMQGACVINVERLLKLSNRGLSPMLKVMRLEYVDSDGEHLLPITDKTVDVPYDFKKFSINIGTTIFTSNHYISYMIDGISDKWSDWQNEGTISFLQLPEGLYKLKIRKYVVKGPYRELDISIKVGAAWYNTVWAWFIYLLIGVLIVRWGLKTYLSLLKKEELDNLEEDNRAEQKKIDDEKRQLLEEEIQNKNNELILRTSALMRKNETIQDLIAELDRQKEALGDRYPNKLYNKLKSMMEDNLNSKSDWLQFESYFNAAHHDFTEKLRKAYPELTSGDLRLCCLLRMNLSTKEISTLLNISIRAVELRRYRLRKRMDLEGDTNLVDYLMNLK